MPYISSAGLRVLLIMLKSVEDASRVLLIMLKSVEDASRFKIFHVQPDVEKILKMTGFDRLLSMPHKNHTANETII